MNSSTTQLTAKVEMYNVKWKKSFIYLVPYFSSSVCGKKPNVNQPNSLLLCVKSCSLPREASCQPVCKQFSARASFACCYNVRVMECGSWTVCLPANRIAFRLLFLMKNVDFVGGELWARGNDCNGFVIASPSPLRPIFFPHNIASVGAREHI